MYFAYDFFSLSSRVQN